MSVEEEQREFGGLIDCGVGKVLRTAEVENYEFKLQ